jgi:Tol biopolymer transport system component
LATGAIQRISTDLTGAQGNHDSATPAWSPDGRSIAFASHASNLVVGDGNLAGDVFVKNLSTAAIQRISTDSLGREGNESSHDPAWSPDGSKIAFTSHASNFAVGDVNGQSDVFVKTLGDGSLQHVSTDAAGNAATDFSAEHSWAPPYGQRIAFSSAGHKLVSDDTNISVDLFVKTLLGGAIERVSTDSANGQANGESRDLAWSPTGTQIAFTSRATNLVAGDTNGIQDVFIKTVA